MSKCIERFSASPAVAVRFPSTPGIDPASRSSGAACSPQAPPGPWSLIPYPLSPAFELFLFRFF